MARGDKGPTARRTPRAAVRFRRFWRDNGRRAAALALTVVLGFETLFSSGVSIALAEAINASGASSQIESVDGTTVTGTGQEGPGATTPDSSPASTVQGENDEATDGSTTTAPENEPGDAATGATTDPDPAPVAVEPWDWTGRTESLTLSSPSGLAFADDAVPADDGTLSATLGLAIALDPSVDGADVGNHTVVLAGDTISAALPEGVTLEPGATFDVFQNDEQGNPSTIRVATATASEDGTALAVTFVEPTDTATGAAYYVGAPVEGTEPAAQAEGKEQLATIDATLALPVLVSAGLLGEEASELVWTLQTDADDPSVTQTATLALPAAPADEAADAEKDGEAAEGADETTETEQAETEPLAPIQLNTLTPFASTEQKVSYELQGFTGSASMTVTWCDNNSADRPKIAEMEDNYVPQFSLDGVTWYDLLDSNGNLTAEATSKLGITSTVGLNWATHASVSRASVGNWDVSATGFPTERVQVTTTPRDDNNDGVQDTDADGNLLWNTTRGDAETIHWRIHDTNPLPEGYVYGENDGGAEGAQRYLMRTATFTFTISGNLGKDTLLNQFGKNFDKTYADDSDKSHVNDFVFGATINGVPAQNPDGTDRTTTIAAMVGNGSFSVNWSDDNTAVITATLPMYDIAGNPIVYSIEFIDHHADVEGHDYFQPAYNNAGSPNHGSATDALYDGGTMTLRPIGTTSYDATKAWLDGNSTDRENVTFTLWRYSIADGNGPTTAAQVQLNAADSPGVASNGVEYVSIEVTADDIGSDGTVDLGKLLNDKYGTGSGDVLTGLPKYDPDGYPYVYALREDTSLSGYETVLGSVDGAGAIHDTDPNWVDVNGELQTSKRGDNDPLIYNGGTVTNRLTGEVPVTATKTWEIAAFQDSLQNVSVTFTAESRQKAVNEPGLIGWLTGLAGGETENDWQPTGETHTLEGFRSETLTQSFTENLPKYDAWGNELEYRWVETGVSVGGEPVAFTQDGNGGGSFSLTLENAAGEQEELTFTSTLERDSETGESLITNTFENITDQHVDKYWQQSDGSMEQIKPAADGYPDYPNLDLSGNVTVRIFRNGEEYASYTLDGTTDKDPTFIESGHTDPKADPYVQETRSYHADFQNLPKYDENGVRYTYLVLEDRVSGWHTMRVYDPVTRTTRMENSVGPGYGSEIRVTKDWVDGADDLHRLDVVVQLVPLHDMTSAADPSVIYKAGEPIDVSAIENTDGSNWIDSATDEITLSADNAWFLEVYVPVNEVDYDDFELVEIALVGEDGEGNEVRYPVTKKEGAEEAYEGLGVPTENWVNAGWSYNTTTGTSRVATPDHVYQTYAVADGGKGAYDYNDEMDAVVARNRRLGLIDLTVIKTWQDGVDPSRPTAELVVSCPEESGVFQIRTNGEVWVQLDGGNAVPVTDGEDAVLIASEKNIKLEGNVQTAADGTQTGDTLVMTVDTLADETTSTYEFFGLPKYDGNGNVVHYDVSERWLNGDNTGATGDVYASSKGETTYMYGEQHFHDEQQETFTNTRTGTRDVTFYKNWNDGYVNAELGQRPDIYLTLYRVAVSRGANGEPVYGEPESVPGYINYTWQGIAVSGNPEYNQSCTIEGLPAYDSQGNEYVYYARETMSVADDGASLDYAPVTFNTGTIDPDALDVEAGERPYLWVGDGDKTDPSTDGRGWALHEDGTFVNSLTSELTANGTKIWENVPVNVSQGDLPELTVYLQRKTADQENWPGLTFTKQTDDAGNVTGWAPGEGQVVAWTSDLHKDANNQYSYKIGYEGENTLDDQGSLVEPEDAVALARYDERGVLYEYRAIEVPWGLYGEPGGFDDADLGIAEGETTTEDLTHLHENENENNQLGVVVIEHGETGSFMLRNRYAPTEKGNLTVEKTFEGRAAGDRYPTTTFDVYRYYVISEDEPSEADLVATKTFTGDEIAGRVGSSGADGNGSFSYTFTSDEYPDLDVYAPDGSRWQYYVVERGIDGYTATVTVGEIEHTTDKPGQDLQSPDLCPTDASGVVTGTVLANDETVDVSFSNTYDKDEIDLTGTKTWVDYSKAFGVRPSADEFKAGLTVTRIGNGGSEDITTQVADSLTVKDNGDGTYAISLTGMERWAPDGNAWQYRITENLSGMTIASTTADDAADDYYTGTASSTVTAGTGQSFSLTNRFTGSAAVEKGWVDGNDPYGLRPESVTVRLQARAGDTGDWQDAETLLKSYVDGELPDDLAAAIADKTLGPDKFWKASWTGLPLHAVDDGGDVVEIQYRVVEVTSPDAATPTDPVGPNDSGEIYGSVHPYVPVQGPDDVDGSDGFVSAITNELEATDVTSSKSWDDAGNVYGTRPASGGKWQATYFLQRTTDPTGASGWEWVVEAGSEADPAGSATQNGVVKFTITDGMAGDANHEVSVNQASGAVTVTWKNLPSCNADGTEYSYRLVEQVPGSYDVEGTDVTQVADTDTAHRYYVVSGVDGQSFTNDLRTTSLTGTKEWDDTEGSIVPEFNDGVRPTMTLHRARKNADGSLVGSETVTYKGTDDGQPTWTQGADGVWEFSYEGLPAANSSDQPYVYWAEETPGSVDGFYPLYGEGNATSSTDGKGTNVVEATADKDVAQTNETITNVPTRLTLAKESDFPNDPVTLTNIELSVIGKDDGRTYAVWTNGASGSEKNVTVWVDGTPTTDPSDQGYVQPTYTRNDGVIMGLASGDYIVRETGNPPTGYAQAADVSLHINTNGTATTGGAVTQTQENGAYTINVTVTDPVLRGHLQLTKHVSNDGGDTTGTGLAGATFDLYVSTDPNNPIATGLTSDANGRVQTNGSNNGNIAFSEAFVSSHNGKYQTLADGLPEGSYYFKETDATPGAVLPTGGYANSKQLTITQQNHYATAGYVTGDMGNVDYSVNVSLRKFDSSNGAGINNAWFALAYYAPGNDTSTPTWTKSYNTVNGTLTLSNLEKGRYVLTETSNQGYESSSFSAEFVLVNDIREPNGETYNITSADCQDAQDINFQVTSAEGTFVDGQGIPNTPIPGSVTVEKTDENGAPLQGATFRLERMNGTDWTTEASEVVEEGLVTDADGRITVGGLAWGTYRFVETSPAPGYVGVDANGAQLASADVTIGRDNVSATTAVSAGTVSNAPTSLELNKQSDVGEALNGAVFTVTPADGSTFADGSTQSIELTTEDTGLATLTGQLVVGGTYEIWEKQGPSGYDPIDDSFQVTVAQNGDLEVVGGDDALPVGWARADVDHDGQVDDQFSFMATNYHMAIELTKVNEDGEALDGVTFTLTGLCMDNNTTHTYTTGRVGTTQEHNVRHGVALIDAGLKGGVDYTLTETAQVDGYIRMSEPLKFHMNDRGEIVIDNVAADGSNPAGWSVGAEGITLTAVNDPVDLRITKVDPEGNPLPGASFSITPVDGSHFAYDTYNELTTGSQGSLTWSEKLVVGGTYDITEVSAPEGYERVEGTMRVTVAEDGSINVLGSVDENGQLIAGSLPPVGYEKVADNSFEVQVTNEPIEIGVVKVDAEDTATALEGTTFEVTGTFAGARDPETRAYTTDDQGRIDLEAELTSGETYTIRETAAPAGYELNVGELSFSVDEKGELTVVGTAPEGWSVARDRVTIVAADQPLRISLAKTSTDGAPLAGATFTVAPAEGAFPDGAQELTFTSDADGVVFNDLQVAGSAEGARYTVTETAPPVGYEALPAFDVLVYEDGTVELTPDAPEAVRAVFSSEQDGGTAVLTVADTPIEAGLAKVSTDGEPLADAAFSVEGRFADGGMPRVVTVGADGTVPLEGLVAGETYVLRETLAPEGYELIVGELTFSVGMDGALTVEGEAPEGYELAADGVTLVATDAPIEAGIVKVSTEGDVLSGAGFEVTGRFSGGDAPETRTVSVSGDGAALEGLVAGETYVLRETVAPEGYELIEGTWSFIVGADGTLAPATGFSPADEGAAGYRVADDGVTLVAADEPVETLPDTSDATRPAAPVAMAAAGVALVAAALAYRRRVRRED